MAEENSLLSASEKTPGLLAEVSPARHNEAWLRRWARRLVLVRLAGLEAGRVEVQDGDFWEQVAWGGSIGAGEAFCDGLWLTPDLTAVVRVLARNLEILDGLEKGTARITEPFRWLLHRFRRNTRAGSNRNIAAHYDIGNEFFAQFLDPTLAYSCAILPDAHTSLESAQRWKLETICRKLGESFDKLISIEMIEAVGHKYLPRYFEVLGELLKPEGLALIQAILIPDPRYESYRRSVDFIQRYVFPGGMLPSFGRIQECLLERMDLRPVGVEDLTSHYARTLVEWRRRFQANDRQIAALGLTAAERRKWCFYFSYCEGGFLERTVTDAQILLAKPGHPRHHEPVSLAEES